MQVFSLEDVLGLTSSECEK